MISQLSLDFVHIPKNAGSSVKFLLKKHKSLSSYLRYKSHSFDCFNSILRNQVVVVRNPIDRFCSAFYYSLKKYPSAPQTRQLLSNDIFHPNALVKALMDPSHKLHSIAVNYISNLGFHRIGFKRLVYKWTYTPQSYWINQPRCVIIMNNFDLEFSELIYHLIGSSISLPHKNVSSRDISSHSSEFSHDSLSFLHSFYKTDFEMFEYYMSQDISDRIPFLLKPNFL